MSIRFLTNQYRTELLQFSALQRMEGWSTVRHSPPFLQEPSMQVSAVTEASKAMRSLLQMGVMALAMDISHLSPHNHQKTTHQGCPNQCSWIQRALCRHQASLPLCGMPGVAVLRSERSEETISQARNEEFPLCCTGSSNSAPASVCSWALHMHLACTKCMKKTYVDLGTYT